MTSFSPISRVIITLALTGSALIGFTCLRQVDVKVIIAYSSLAHIELTITTIIYLGNIGTRDVILLILAHEFSSSRIFFGENSFLRKFPRRIDLIKRISNYIFPLLSFFGLITIIKRMATLPLLNFVAEIIYICSTLAISFSNAVWIVLSVFLGEDCFRVLYSRTQQSRFFRIRPHLSFSALPERILFFTQLGWLFLLVLSLD